MSKADDFLRECKKNVGKWTMIASFIPFILALLGYIFKWE